MSVYATLTSAPHRWLYEEAAHFVSVLNMSFEDWDVNEQALGKSEIETVLLDSLIARAHKCPIARSPADLVAAWAYVVADRRLPARARVTLAPHDVDTSCPAVAGVATPAAPPVSGVSNSIELPADVDDYFDDGEDIPAPNVSDKLTTGKRAHGIQSVNELQRATLKMTKRQRAVLAAAASPEACASAIARVEERMLAARTWSSHGSQVSLYVRMCMTRNLLPPFPVNAYRFKLFGALLTDHYAADSVGQYLNAVLRHQSFLDMPIQPELKKMQSDLCRAANRGAGDSHRMLPISFEMLREMRDFVKGVFNMFLFRIALLTWYFVMRIDESLGASGAAGLARNAFEFDPAVRSVTVTLGVTKMNSQGVKCRRTHFCCCDPTVERVEPDKSLPMCPYCAAWVVCCQNDDFPDQPMRPPTAKSRARCDAPKASNMMDFLRSMLALLAAKFPAWGLDLTSDTGRAMYGTQSLRRGAAQALILAGWSLEDVKFFGRWLSHAIELYLLQVPMQNFGQRVSASMGTLKSVSKLSGADELASGEFEPTRVLSRCPVSVKSVVRVKLPDMLFDSVDERGVATVSDADDSIGDFVGTVIAVLPHFPHDLRERAVVFHHSIVTAFPDSFSDFSARLEHDRCVVLDFSDADVSAEEVPLLVVSFSVLPFSVVSA